MICTYMFKRGTYYIIVYSTYVHSINMYVHVYTRWVGFQMKKSTWDELEIHLCHSMVFQDNYLIIAPKKHDLLLDRTYKVYDMCILCIYLAKGTC